MCLAAAALMAFTYECSLENNMTIVDKEIQTLVETQQLISPFEVANLENCRYNLRAGKAFLPKTGEEIAVGAGKWKKRDYWVVKPSETLVIMTKETIKVPSDMFASYSQLNTLARRGLMLFNVSIVEPGYNGHLSCFLVNFSLENAYLYPDNDIAKLCFHKLTSAPQDLKSLTISEENYKRDLVKSAQLYPISFMDIGGVEERIVDRATKRINKSITVAVVFIAILVFWTALEPVVSKYLWEKQGVMTSTQRLDIMKLQQELEKTKYDLSKASDDLKAEKRINALEEALKAQGEQLTKLQQSLKRP
jgi:deoxycytidine triphosphate deaminase